MSAGFDFPKEFASLKDAARYVLKIEYQLDALSELRMLGPRQLDGTVLAGRMMAEAQLNENERADLRKVALDETCARLQKRAMEVVWDG